MIKTIKDMFIYVPKGSSKQFITVYAKDDAYKQKIAFVEDTAEIWTNGKAFGVNESSKLDELTTKLSSLESSLSGINTTEFKKITDWITTHGTDFTKVTTDIESIKQSVTAEVERSIVEDQKISKHINKINAKLTEIENVQVWKEFTVDKDAPVITEETKTVETPEDVAALVSKNPEETDIVILTDNAMSYFKSSKSATFKNITL